MPSQPATAERPPPVRTSRSVVLDEAMAIPPAPSAARGTPSSGGVTHVLRELGFRPVTVTADQADLLHDVPAAADGSDSGWEVRYEVDGEWSARRTAGARDVAPIQRFVDGAARLTLLATQSDTAGGWSAVVGGVIGAAALRLDAASGRPTPEPASPPLPASLHDQEVVALPLEDVPAELRHRMEHELYAVGVQMLDVRPRVAGPEGTHGPGRARAAAHSRCLSEMQRLERIAAAGAAGEPREPTIVDGNLGDHLGAAYRHQWPLIGVIKRHHAMPLPPRLHETIWRLSAGERTPAFLIAPGVGTMRPPILSWYLKVAGDAGSAFSGTIRVEVSLPWAKLEAGDEGPALASWMDALSRRVISLRAVRQGYSREDCSLHPIIVLEDYLHARFGSIEAIHMLLRRKLGLNR